MYLRLLREYMKVHAVIKHPKFASLLDMWCIVCVVLFPPCRLFFFFAIYHFMNVLLHLWFVADLSPPSFPLDSGDDMFEEGLHACPSLLHFFFCYIIILHDNICCIIILHAEKLTDKLHCLLLLTVNLSMFWLLVWQFILRTCVVLPFS